MNNFENLFRSIFNKKNLLVFYFAFFIVLNIADFLNKLPGDIDFFKKLLSWSIIGYVFYKASFTKIAIGNKVKLYDLLFVLTFCLFTIPKSLLLIKETLSLFIFDFFVTLIPISTILLPVTFFLGLILIIVLSIALLMNHKVTSNSFIGSFDFKENYFSYIFKKFFLIIFAFFFGFVIFNFFMEWFALAVDSVILVLGVAYYLIYYIHRHTKINTNYLSKVSNTGNAFYQNLINNFSNKKTFFIGVSFLLTLHLLVDAGVFMIPYTIGTENALYFDSLDKLGTDHTPLFNVFDYDDSLAFKDISIVDKEFFLSMCIVGLYVISLFLGYSFLILPFYIFFKNIQNQKINIKNIFVILFLSFIALFFLFKVFASVSFPLNIDIIVSEFDVKGVDINTSQIINSFSFVFLELIYLILLFFVVLIFLLFRYERYKFYFDKIFYIFVLVFFIYYIMLFFISTIQVESKTLVNFISELDSEEKYQLFDSYEQSNTVYLKSLGNEYINGKNLRLAYISLGDSKKHYDFIVGSFVLVRDNNFYFGNLDNLYINDGNYFDVDYFEILNYTNFEFIYYFGENIYDVNERGLVKVSGRDLVKLFEEENDVEFDFNLIKSKEEVKKVDNLSKFSEIFRILFLSVFYIFGIIGFMIFYVKKNIIEN